MSSVNLDRIHVQAGKEGSGNITEGQSLSHGYVLFLPLTSASATSANGNSLDGDSLAILAPGSDFCIGCVAEHDWCSIFVPTDLFAPGDEPPAGELHQEGRPRLPRQEIIRRSRELLEHRDGEHVLVADLAAAANVSERTLRTTFSEYFGVGPARYLQLRQLHQVHRALRAADPEAVTVSEVLVRHGQWEFSRFASRYRRQFGELPSDTLRAKTP